MRFLTLGRSEVLSARFFDNFASLPGLFMLAVVKWIATFLKQRTSTHPVFSRRDTLFASLSEGLLIPSEFPTYGRSGTESCRR